MTTIRSLEELTGGETPAHFGRSLYKYTDCGPWTCFVMPDKPERVERFIVDIRKDSATGKLTAKARTSERASGAELAAVVAARTDALMFLGFAADGHTDCGWRSLRALRDRIDRFFRKEANTTWNGKWSLTDNALCIGLLRVRLERTIPASTRTVYYESDEASKPLPGCVGVEVGSIVEGSDVEIPPETLLFPFERERFDEVVERIDRDASVVWDWANVTRDKLGRKCPNGGKTDAERGLDCPIF